jgi:hypothetical protein
MINMSSSISRREFLTVMCVAKATLDISPVHSTAAASNEYQRTVFMADAYGVLGDGVTDNITALRALGTAAQGINEPVTIVLPGNSVLFC